MSRESKRRASLVQPLGNSFSSLLSYLWLVRPSIVHGLRSQLATDAAPDFRFGISVAGIPAELAACLARKSERRGDHIRLDRTTGILTEPEKPRLGTPIRLDLDPDHFTDVLSLRASKLEHSGSLELKGVRLGLR